MPFYDLTTLLLRQLVQHLSKMLAYRPEYRLLPPRFKNLKRQRRYLFRSRKNVSQSEGRIKPDTQKVH